jgi:chromate transporter
MDVPPSKKEKNSTTDVSFWQAFMFWLKLGFIRFVSPVGQVFIMHQELAENRR